MCWACSNFTLLRGDKLYQNEIPLSVTILNMPRTNYCFFFIYTGFPPGFGVSGIGGDHQKDPPKNFFLPAKAVVARFARASLQATEWRSEGCTRFDSSHVKLHTCVVW